MAKRLTKKMMFILSLAIVGFFGLINSIIVDNFSKSKSAFKKENLPSLPNFTETAHADIPPIPGGDGSDGSGDGSNGY
jgi:hypothetical protein